MSKRGKLNGLAKENLNQAYEKVKANKGVAGVDGITVYEVDEYIKTNKEKLLNQIRKRKYKPQPVKRVQIPNIELNNKFY